MALASSFILFPLTLALSRLDPGPTLPSVTYVPTDTVLFNRPAVILLTNPHTAHYSVVRMRSVACNTYVP